MFLEDVPVKPVTMDLCSRERLAELDALLFQAEALQKQSKAIVLRVAILARRITSSDKGSDKDIHARISIMHEEHRALHTELDNSPATRASSAKLRLMAQEARRQAVALRIEALGVRRKCQKERECVQMALEATRRLMENTHSSNDAYCALFKQE